MKLTQSLLTAGAVIALSGCGRAPETSSVPPLPTAAVQVQTVTTRGVEATEEVVGTVRSKLRAAVEAKISGRITALPVIAGQSLLEGGLIAQLDAREVQARLDQAKAALENADRDLQRYATLMQQQVMTRAEFDAAESRQRMARAAVAEAEAMLDHTRVVAPFGGVITRKPVEVGDLASPGRVIVEMEDPKTLRVEADVPEALIELVKVGTAMRVAAPGLTVPVEAKVSELSPAADPNSRTFPVKLDLPANAALRLGQFVRVAVPVGQADSLAVPFDAVVVRGQMELVFVVNQGVAQLRLVKMGKRVGAAVEIVSGLAAGETIVVQGAATLRDGQPVQINP
jgi:RND family efflux transporter MFP subunit